ncbi:MAG: histidine phosphatase family protein [Actinomycetota bacterium]|nr:histidine phosphatase family protein [Actinomycetota bacterium]
MAHLEDGSAYGRSRFYSLPLSAARSVAPGGESVQHLKSRLAALKSIAVRHPDGRIGAVTHEVLLRVALVEATGEAHSFWDRAIPTGSIWTVDMDRNHQLRLGHHSDSARSG